MSRVKEAVKSGHNAVHNGVGSHAAARSDGGGRTGYPPGSTWVSGAYHYGPYSQEGTSYGQPGSYDGFTQGQGQGGPYSAHGEPGLHGRRDLEETRYGGHTGSPHTAFPEGNGPAAPPEPVPSGFRDGSPAQWQQHSRHPHAYNGQSFGSPGEEQYGASSSVNGDVYGNNVLSHDSHGDRNARVAHEPSVDRSETAGPGDSRLAEDVSRVHHSQARTYTGQQPTGGGWYAESPILDEVPPPPEPTPPQESSETADPYSSPSGFPHSPEPFDSPSPRGLAPARTGPSSSGVADGVDGFYARADVPCPPEQSLPPDVGGDVAGARSYSPGDGGGSSEPSSYPPAWNPGNQHEGANFGVGGASASISRESVAESPTRHDGDMDLALRGDADEVASANPLGNPSHVTLGGAVHDDMQGSVSPELGKVDWREGAGEGSAEPVAMMGGFDGGVGGGGEDEEALLRELERMDAIDRDEAGVVQAPEELEDDTEDTDEAVEYTLDALFSSIRDEDEGSDVEAPPRSLLEHLDAGNQAPAKGDDAFVHPSELEDRGVGSSVSDHVTGGASWPSEAVEDAEVVGFFDEHGVPVARSTGAAAPDLGGEYEPSASSTDGAGEDSWTSQAVIPSEPEPLDGEEDGGAEDPPLDPIELPPSAAADEFWNDQHLQDQLDAYWEQSRRSGGLAGGLSSAGQQQLARYGQYLQPTYGPGDWVGRGAEGTAVVQEPLPRSERGVVQSDIRVPNLFQGNQAPINIYGNIYVGHPEKRPHEGQQSSPAELGARDRFFAQGETTWSGSKTGGI